MKIVLSPAKALDFSLNLPTTEYSTPQLLQQTEKIHKKLVSKKPQFFAKLMNISSSLAELNYQRYQNWNFLPNEKNSRPAAFAFRGSVYLGLDAYSLTREKISLLQEKVRILSGFYGILKPLDLIQAHRLEMGTELKIGKKNNLYQFWGKNVTQLLKQDLAPKEELVNLASKEYFKVIEHKKISNSIITPVFQDFKNGKYKVIQFFAKKARGMMVRFILDKNIDSPEGIKQFNYENYSFQTHLSDEQKFVFTRKQV